MSRVKALVKEQIIAAQPDSFYDGIKGLPRAWLCSQSGLALGFYVDPARPLYEVGLYHSNSSSLDDPIPTSANSPCGLTHAKEEALFSPLRAEAEELATEAKTKKAEVMAYLRSMRTVEKVIATTPELEPYLPKQTAKAYPVAPSNLLASLSKSGFDINVA